MKLFRLVLKVLSRDQSAQKQQNLRNRLDFAMSQTKEL
jgi:hypothetical protein